MKAIYYIPVLALAATLAACEQDYEPNIHNETEGRDMLTLNSIVCPDSTISLMATRTYLYTDYQPRRDYVADLQPVVRIEGEEVATMTFNPKVNLYESDVKPRPGQTVEIMAGDVTATTTVPWQIAIDDLRYTAEKMPEDSPYHHIVKYNITFTDPEGTDNYYFLRITHPMGLIYFPDEESEDQNVSYTWEGPVGNLDYSYEYVFQVLAGQLGLSTHETPDSYTGMPFCDLGIDGKTHTINIIEKLYDRNPYYMLRRVSLYAISNDYYLYMLSAMKGSSDVSTIQGGLIDLGLTQPVKYYTNVLGGTGILGAYTYTDTMFTIDVDV